MLRPVDRRQQVAREADADTSQSAATRSVRSAVTTSSPRPHTTRSTQPVVREPRRDPARCRVDRVRAAPEDEVGACAALDPIGRIRADEPVGPAACRAMVAASAGAAAIASPSVPASAAASRMAVVAVVIGRGACFCRSGAARQPYAPPPARIETGSHG
jgi:hypothetical protein